jgi:hypothetical protein
VIDYYRKMKGMVDALRGLGKPLPDRTLVLNILRGLNKRYNHLKTFLKLAIPFPSFHGIHNDLMLEDITMGVEAISNSATDFVASDGQQSCPPPSAAPRATSLGGLCPLPPLVVVAVGAAVVGLAVVAGTTTTGAL